MHKLKTDPSSTSNAYDFMIPMITLVRTLLAGTPAMREAGRLYLPQHKAESSDRYKERLETTVLLPRTEQILDTLSSKPFVEKVQFSDDTPEKIQEILQDDADLLGNGIDSVCSKWFKGGMSDGLSHMLIESPSAATKEDGARSLDDDRREGIRPYWVSVDHEDLIFASAEVVKGVETLTQVRIKELIVEQDGFIEIEIEQIRVLEPGKITIYRRKNPEKKNSVKKNSITWSIHETILTGLDIIPLVTFYIDREGFMISKPPLLGLAYLNTAHWQSSSDQRHILTTARLPILAQKDKTIDASKVIIGTNKMLTGDYYYVEHTGKAIEAGQKDLTELDEQMTSYGAEFLRKKPGNQTATARALDSAESSSDLSQIVLSFESALQTALSFTALYLNLDEGGSISVSQSFEVDDFDSEGLKLTRELRKDRDISRKAMLEVAKERGLLPESYDIEADAQQIANEMSLAGETLIDIDPAQDDADS